MLVFKAWEREWENPFGHALYSQSSACGGAGAGSFLLVTTHARPELPPRQLPVRLRQSRGFFSRHSRLCRRRLLCRRRRRGAPDMCPSSSQSRAPRCLSRRAASALTCKRRQTHDDVRTYVCTYAYAYLVVVVVIVYHFHHGLES
jgi:hypothetical protein